MTNKRGMTRGQVRSNFELKIAKDLEQRRVKFKYESTKLSYMVPERLAKYTPDILLGNGIFVEIKGRLTAGDRKKMVNVKLSNPTLDIRFVFMRANNPIRKGSKTTYGDWAESKGFKWAEGTVPDSWIKE